MTTVLVVDDEFGITDALSDVLEDEGYHVLTARNGKDGLKRIQEQRPDIILLDFMMPVMDGRAMLQALAADPSLRDIPAILMSAIPESSIRLETRPAAFLRKPFQLATLFATLRRALDGASGQ